MWQRYGSGETACAIFPRGKGMVVVWVVLAMLGGSGVAEAGELNLSRTRRLAPASSMANKGMASRNKKVGLISGGVLSMILGGVGIGVAFRMDRRNDSEWSGRDSCIDLSERPKCDEEKKRDERQVMAMGITGGVLLLAGVGLIAIAQTRYSVSAADRYGKDGGSSHRRRGRPGARWVLPGLLSPRFGFRF
jgi:hypothetical protein